MMCFMKKHHLIINQVYGTSENAIKKHAKRHTIVRLLIEEGLYSVKTASTDIHRLMYVWYKKYNTEIIKNPV